LEVKELDAISKDKEEEKDPSNMGNDYRDKEIMVITPKFLKECIYRLFCSKRKRNFSLQVPKLRCNDAIDCPSNWGSPVVPPPPYGDQLQLYKN